MNDLTTLLRDLEHAFGAAIVGTDSDRAEAFRLLTAARPDLPRAGAARTVNETVFLHSEPPFTSRAATTRWFVRAERTARRMRKRLDREQAA